MAAYLCYVFVFRHQLVKRLGCQGRKNFSFFSNNDGRLMDDSVLFPFIDVL